MLTRRSLVALAAAAPFAGAQAQNAPVAAPAPAPAPRFSFDDVLRRARELAAAPFDAAIAPLPEPFSGLDYDAFRDIRFRADRAIFAQSGSPFRMQLFHPGFLYRRAVIVNVVRGGVPAPIPYAPTLFDYGRTKVERPPPVNLGFAGFRLHYPLNDPRVFDELIAFLGASYFRFLGRGQRYGLSARGLAVGVGAAETEEFPFFREFWIETPEANADRAVIYALLDGESVTGAYQFLVYPSAATVVDVTATIIARRAMPRIGLAPLTSMFYSGENEPRRLHQDYRAELHDSDGLLIQSGAGEWIWRPLRNPSKAETSSFVDANVRGFGLMQRDRVFEHYQDLESEYHLRPSYWVEPREGWGEGRVELFEIPTVDETNDNIVAYWAPKAGLEAGQSASFGYRLHATSLTRLMQPGGFALNTFVTEARARGTQETPPPGSRRFIVDFAGGDLAFYLPDPGAVELVPSISRGQVLRATLTPNGEAKGFRALIDAQVEPGQTADLRAFLRAGSRALTETWLYPVRGE